MNKIQGFYARMMENPHELMVTVLCTVMCVWLLLNTPFYAEMWIEHFPRDDTGEDPTLRELMDYVDEDNTDQNTYHKKFYNCVSFTKDLLSGAKSRGIRGYFVIIDDSYCGEVHAIAMFNTTDFGKIYIEPQADSFIHPDDIVVLKEIIY